jgi:ribonuclease E
MSSKSKHRPRPAAPAAAEPVAAAPEPAMFTAPPSESTSPPEPASEAAAAIAPSLAVRVREATGRALVGSFASLRAAQATAVERALALITRVDAALSRTLGVTEARLMSLVATPAVAAPAPASEPAVAEA